jgi:hypothetical protein
MIITRYRELVDNLIYWLFGEGARVRATLSACIEEQYDREENVYGYDARIGMRACARLIYALQELPVKRDFREELHSLLSTLDLVQAEAANCIGEHSTGASTIIGIRDRFLSAIYQLGEQLS